ncbi:MAG: Pycsar system effector family protein [Dehalococcoidia bacterium]
MAERDEAGLDAYLDRLQGMITLADNKAVASISVSVVVAGFAGSIASARLAQREPFESAQLDPIGWYCLFAFLAVVAALWALVFGALTLTPRNRLLGTDLAGRNPYFFGDAYKMSFDTFLSALRDERLAEDGRAEQAYQLASIVAVKFKMVFWSLWGLYVTLAAALLTGLSVMR